MTEAEIVRRMLPGDGAASRVCVLRTGPLAEIAP